MAGGQEKWYFTKEQLQTSPSRKCGLDADKELAYRQQAANLIQDMGQRLQVSQLCINTAIVYMHRFYAFHSFTQFHRNAIAAAALFLAAKVEEQPRKLEYVIKVAHVCLHRGEGVNALTTEQYTEQAQDLVFNENVLLQTLGFDVAIDHPHTHVVRTCHLVKASKDLAQTSYFMASNSLHLTTMCLQYKPTVVACFCIHLASKWSNWVIAQSHEGKPWFSYVDRTVTSDLLERLTAEFLHIFDKCPSRLKRKMMTMSNSGGSPHASIPSQPGILSSSIGVTSAVVPNTYIDKKHLPPNMDEFDKSFDKEYERERRRQPIPGGYVPAPLPSSLSAPPNPQQPQKIDFNMYKDRDKKEKEERERREERDRRQAMQQQPRPGPPQPRASSSSSQPAHHQRPSTGQHHHKPHGWPHHKPPHHKVPHDYRHRPDHRPQIPPGSTASAPIPPHPSQSQPEILPQRTRPPSLFSPENATTPSAAAAAAPRKSQPPQQKPHPSRPEHRPNPPVPAASISQMIHDHKPSSPHKKRSDATVALREMQAPAILSPFSSPPTSREIKEVRDIKEIKEMKEIKEKKEAKEYKEMKDQKPPRPRLHSNSEPELVPVVKKLDETPGYENVIRDSQRGNAIKTKFSEHKRPDASHSRSMNGIETDPTLVSNLLKESLAKPVPITVPMLRKSPLVEMKKEPPPEIAVIPPQIPVLQEPTAQIQPPQPPTEEVPEQKHKKEKKKKEKHKHKDRDKSKDEKKKHKKDRDKEKKKEPSPQPPPPQQPPTDSLKITIPRDKLATSPGLKIKIPKERLAVNIPPPQQASSLKIKISKELLENSRKRTGAHEPGPPQKIARQNGAPHPKVGNWNIPPPFRQPLPYYMVQPPPPLYYGMMDGYFYGATPVYAPPQPQPQPPLPAMPPPPVPPPPPE